MVSLLRGQDVLKPGDRTGKVSPSEFVGEMKGYVWEGGKGVKEAFVESGAIDGLDGLGAISCECLILGGLGRRVRWTHSAMNIVLLGFFIKRASFGNAVNHAGMHRDGLFKNRFDKTRIVGLPHGIYAAF